ncbi:MAG: MFS transporter [Ruminococcaceae bacterium]|nr:MFS transporter [Oscillospiraceae bacterium]MBR3597614.1 MFS transporter [Clostridia bacterium]
MEKKMSKKLWFNILLFSLMGQVAWNVENMYFNTFLYNSVYEGTPEAVVDAFVPAYTAITWMVQLSAITAVLTTFIMGTLSDKMRNRKLFISGGYVAWGIITALFGFISKDNVSALLGITDEVKVLAITVWIVIIMDSIMTFMGSTSNDSAFNAWVTDVTIPAVRPKVEFAFSVLPVLAMGIVMGIGTFAQSGKISYSAFFICLGAFVTICGILGFFLIKEPEHKVIEKKEDSNYFKNLIYGFKPSVISENSRLYLALLALGFSSIATQVFFPLLLPYLQYVILPASEGINFLSAGTIIPVVISLIAAIGLLVLLLKLIKTNKKIAMYICIGVFTAALFALSFSHNIVTVIVSALPLLPAMLIFSIHIGACVRDFTPLGKAGVFQGVRMIFAVLLPMLIGPALGNLASKLSGLTYVTEYKEVLDVPSSEMFLYAAVVMVLAFIPMFFLAKKGFEVENTD